MVPQICDDSYDGDKEQLHIFPLCVATLSGVSSKVGNFKKLNSAVASLPPGSNSSPNNLGLTNQICWIQAL